MEPIPFRTLSTDTAWKGPWFSVRRDHIALPTGEHTTYDILDKCEGVIIVPVTENGTILLLREYRHPVLEWMWAVPAGGVKDGQSPEDAAKTELLEEVGGTAKALHHLGRFYSSPGTTNEAIHLFLATGVTCGPTSREALEIMEVHEKPIDEVLAMAKAGDIVAAPSVLAILLSEARLTDR